MNPIGLLLAILGLLLTEQHPLIGVALAVAGFTVMLTANRPRKDHP